MKPDVEALITFLKTEEGGRSMLPSSGYRPAHLVKDNYLTTGVHHYYDKEDAELGKPVLGTISFITPKAYLNCLWEGKVINVQEGSRIVGYAKITKIFNAILKAE